MAYKALKVDYAQMEKLRDTLREASERTNELGLRILEDIKGLDESWKGPNCDAFMQYFYDRFIEVKWYCAPGDTNYLGYQAEWIDKAIQLYKTLEADIDDQVKAKLAGGV